jgi:exosortase
MSELSILTGVTYAGPDTQNAPKTYFGLSSDAWMRIGVLALLMVGLFWPNLRRLFLKTNPITGEANWAHAFFVPLIGLYYLFLNRDALLKARVHISYLGLAIMIVGLLMFGYGIWPGQNDFVKDFAMVVTLFGLVAFMCGWQVMKIAWFPIVFLIAAIPWPGLVYSWVALPLQKIAAAAAIKVLNIIGVESYREGTKLIIIHGLKPEVLNVAEACAGLKSLMTFISIGAAIGFLPSRPTWQKIAITLSAIPVAIFCNSMRVTGIGILHHYWSEDISKGFTHQFVGLIIMLVSAFLLILLVAWILDNIFIEEADKRALPAPGSRSTLIEIPRVAGPKGAVAPAVQASKPQPAKAAAPAPKPQPAKTQPAPAPRPAAAPITASVITQTPITASAAPKVAPAPQVRSAPVARPAAAPAVKPAAVKPAAPASAPAGNDLAAATARLTAIRRPKPATPPPAPQANPPKSTEGK